MNEFCFIDSPIGVLELEAESNYISRIKFKEGDKPWINNLVLTKNYKFFMINYLIKVFNFTYYF